MANAQPNPFRPFSRFALALSILTFMLIVLGATVRSMGAGLACPDWPLCHGQLIPPMDPEIFIEWFHRLVAALVSTLFLGLAIWVVAIKELRQKFLGFVLVSVALLITQIVLGALTVMKLLAFETVTMHLGTGTLFLTSLALITIMAFKEAGSFPALAVQPGIIRPLAFVAMLATYGQILLGGLVSTKYAALACPDFPTCHGMLFPPMEGAVATHMIHRYGAYTLALLITALMIVARKSPDAFVRRGTMLAFGLVAVQVCLGIANVLFQVPVPLSASHLGVAELILMTLLVVNLGMLGERKIASAARPALAQ
jgi:cytochrome c oxidase assembly protein subunit 15